MHSELHSKIFSIQISKVLQDEMNIIGQAKKIIPLFLEILLAKKVFTWRAAKNSINLSEFFKQSLHLKNYSNSTVFIEKQRALLLLFEGEKNVN